MMLKMKCFYLRSYFAAGLLLFLSVNAQAGSDAQQNSCCDALLNLFPEKVVLKSDAKAYSAVQSSYWTPNAQEVAPGCFIQPTTTEEVSRIVSQLTTPENREKAECKFAVKSGGHTFWATAASIEGGVTIDLAKLNQIEISVDKKVAKIGPGNRWGDVFNVADKSGLTVSGGRMSPVGVGGFLTGGGLSYLQGAIGGWSCDGILNHEVVLANGTIVNANKNENSDLHQALKGGGNNFGIVTRFDLRTFERPKLWSGAWFGSNRNKALTWLSKTANSSINANTMAAVFVLGPNSTMSLGSDPDVDTEPALFVEASKFNQVAAAPVQPASSSSSLIASLLSSPLLSSGIGSVLGMLLPKGPGMPTTVPTLPTGVDMASGKTYGLTSPANFAYLLGVGSAKGPRMRFFSWNVKNNANTVSYLESLSDLITQEGKKLPPKSGTGTFYQPITAKMRATGQSLGGENAMGLTEFLGDDDLILVALTVPYFVKSDGKAVEDWAKSITAQGKELAKEKGVYTPWQYVNYSDGWQDAIGTYPQKARDFLWEVSRKYDPNQTFQKQVPGGFKLR